MWYLDLVHSRGAKLVLAVDVRTRWAFVLPAAPFVTLEHRFGPALFEALIAVGVPPDRARHEVDSAQPYRWARLTDRSVQAHLRQCKQDAAWAAADGSSIPSINRRLSGRPILAPREIWPEAEVLRCLGGDPELPGRRAREGGQHWQKGMEIVRAQSENADLRLPVALLLCTDRLEAGHQARMLFVHVRGSLLRFNPGRPETLPRQLVLDMTGVHAIEPAFLDELAALMAAHAGMALDIQGLEPEAARILGR